MNKRFAVSSIFKAVDKVSSPLSRMQSSSQKFTRSMRRGLHRVNRSLDRTISASKKVAFAGFGALAAAAAGTTLALKGLADQGDALAKQSRRLKFPIDALQEWKFAAEQSGVSNELFDNSMGAFSKRLGEARAGMGSLFSTLKKTNPQLLKQLVAAKSVDKALELFVDGMRKTKNAQDKAALASAAFSRAGLKMVDISVNSAVAIKKLRQEQRQNGILTMKQAENAEAYNDAMNSLTKSFEGLRITALAPLLPILTEYSRKTRKAIIENKKMVSQNIGRMFKAMTKNYKEFLKVGKGIVQLISGIFILKAALLAGQAAMMAATVVSGSFGVGLLFLKGLFLQTTLAQGASTLQMATWYTGMLLGKTAMLGFNAVMVVAKGVIWAVNAAWSANPIGAVIAGIVLLVGAGVLLVKKWGVIKTFFLNFWKDLKSTTKSAVDSVFKSLSVLAEPFKNIFGGLSSIQKSFKGVFKVESEHKRSNAPKALLQKSKNAPALKASVQAPQLVSPQERVARHIEEKRSSTSNTTSLIIEDKSGSARLSDEELASNSGVSLIQSGAY